MAQNKEITTKEKEEINKIFRNADMDSTRKNFARAGLLHKPIEGVF